MANDKIMADKDKFDKNVQRYCSSFLYYVICVSIYFAVMYKFVEIFTHLLLMHSYSEIDL